MDKNMERVRPFRCVEGVIESTGSQQEDIKSRIRLHTIGLGRMKTMAKNNSGESHKSWG